jgi:uncharacterized protein DUF4350
VANRSQTLGPILWLVAVMAALLAAGYFLWTQDTRRGAHNPEYSVVRTDDRGAAIVYRLYRSAGLKPQVWDRELTSLVRPGILLLLAPGGQGGGGGDVLPHEVEALDRWVRQGNVAVIMTRQPNPIYQGIGLLMDEPEALSGTPAEPAQPSLLARRVSALQTQTRTGFIYGRKKSDLARMLDVEETPPPIDPVPADRWLELFVKKDGVRTMPQVVSAARGKGLYVAVNDVFPAGNLGVTMADNARFMLNLARLNPKDGTIWFDEFHKRDVERGFVAYLRERAFTPALIYLVLLVGLLFWRTGVRFGAAMPLVVDRRRDSGEYIRAVAALYRNAGMTREALTTIYADFRQRLIGALRTDGLANLDEVGRRYQMRTGRPAAEAREILIEAEAALAREKLDDAEALHFCARLTQLDQALHRQAKGTDGHRKE